jgi:5'-methylthioadenosine phosphorylase
MSDQSKGIGIIGGSGVYNIEGIELINEHTIETPFGAPSSPVIEARLGGVPFFFIPRHGKAHTILPGEVNYRANIFAMKKLGVEYIISVSAVGSLKEELPPTTFVLVDQFIDWTKGSRDRSFFGNGIVAHVSNANPVNRNLQEILISSCENAGVSYSKNGTYLCIEGPQFSTRAESHLYREMNASVIGMTNVPEAFLAKEAGIAYATIAMVTDFDAWKEEHCTVDEVMRVMGENNKNAQGVIELALGKLNKEKFDVEKENRIGVMTPKENWNPDQRVIMEVLLA